MYLIFLLLRGNQIIFIINNKLTKGWLGKTCQTYLNGFHFIHKIKFWIWKLAIKIGTTIDKRCRKFSVLKLGPWSEIAANVNLLEGNLLIFMKIIYFTLLATFICRDWPGGIWNYSGSNWHFHTELFFFSWEGRSPEVLDLLARRPPGVPH